MSMKTTNKNDVQVTHEKIAQRAKEIWERDGRQAGRDLEYWLQAERELLFARSGSGNNRNSTGAGGVAPPPKENSTAQAQTSTARSIISEDPMTARD